MANKQSDTPEIPHGYVRVRVLPKGHGQVHTGKNAAPRLDPDPEREALTGDARLKADAAALIEASVACGQTYGRGETFHLPKRNAEALEARGHVEIL
jgi:hypothetical protein